MCAPAAPRCTAARDSHSLPWPGQEATSAKADDEAEAFWASDDSAVVIWHEVCGDEGDHEGDDESDDENGWESDITPAMQVWKQAWGLKQALLGILLDLISFICHEGQHAAHACVYRLLLGAQHIPYSHSLAGKIPNASFTCTHKQSDVCRLCTCFTWPA